VAPKANIDISDFIIVSKSEALVVVPVTIMIKKTDIPGGYVISVEMLPFVTVSPIKKQNTFVRFIPANKIWEE